MNILHQYTVKTLGKNRVRTAVTVIGIVLSVAMLTAVVTSITSLQHFLLQIVLRTDGAWHGHIVGLDKAGQEALALEEGVSQTAFLQTVGYAALENVPNKEKPYLFIGGIGGGLTDLLPIHLIEGRLPQIEGELILPSHMTALHGGFAVGQSFSLLVGDRLSNGQTLGQRDRFVSMEEGGEALENRQTRIFTVVGVYEKPTFEPGIAPGYTGLTVADDTARLADGYFTMQKPGDTYDLLEQEPYAQKTTRVNGDYMMFSGTSDDSGFQSVLFGMGAVLVAIIVFGSVSLIYNSFSISVSERTRQFGLLSSVGATRRQMRRSVLFEALFLSAIGIPGGLLAGLLGIGVTLRFLEKPFLSFADFGVYGARGARLSLWTSREALLLAGLLGLLTVLLSAWIPARRALRVSTIDAIRQTKDVKLSARRVKTSKLTMALFGIEGVLASKNFKRSRKQYRATVISLFVSVVLFISASSFGTYMMAGASEVLEEARFDLAYSAPREQMQDPNQLGELFAALSAVNGVRQSAYAYLHSMATVVLPTDAARPELLSDVERLDWVKDGQVRISAQFIFLDDATYQAYAGNAPNVILDSLRFRDPEGRVHTVRALKKGGVEGTVEHAPRGPEGYDLIQESDGFDIVNPSEIIGALTYVYQSRADGSEITLTEDDVVQEWTVLLGEVAEKAPFAVEPNRYGLTILYPYSAIERVLGGMNLQSGQTRLYFAAENHKTQYHDMLTLLAGKGLPTGRLFNHAENREAIRGLVLVLNVFSYGFIALISLISVANVFNTISTNIGLRRRELAMLKSIGTTKRGFHRMMNFECLLYGFKGLVYGIPAALGMTWLMYRAMSGGWETSYFVPWQSILISVGSVFVVVFATMLYSMGKIRKDNLVDTLKNENL